MSHVAGSSVNRITCVDSGFAAFAARADGMDDERTLMLAGVAHDLRTPLTNIRLAIELLRMEKSSALIDSVCRNIKDMDVLIAQFLDFARADTLESANRVD